MNEYHASVKTPFIADEKQLELEKVHDDGDACSKDVPNAHLSASKLRWASICIAWLSSFCQQIQTSIYITVLWPWMTELDPSTQQYFFGIALAAQSIGAALLSPILGWWSDRIKSTKLPGIICWVIIMISQLLMAFVKSTPGPKTNRKWVILTSQLLVGMGRANFGLASTFLSHATTITERSRVLGVQSGCLSLALMFGPALATVFTNFGYPGWVSGPVELNMYTAISWLGVCTSVICIILYGTIYKDFAVSIAENKSRKTDNTVSVSRDFNKSAVVICIGLRFVMLFCIQYDQTVLTPLCLTMFNWTRAETIYYSGWMEGLCGVVEAIGIIFLGFWLIKWVKPRVCIVAGVVLLAAFYLVSFPWPGLPPISTASNNSFPVQNQSERNYVANYTSENVPEGKMGCHHDWCEYTPKIYVSQLVTGFVFLGLGVGVGFTTVTILISHLLDGQYQGAWQGLSFGVGCVASAISPIVVSYLFQTHGPRVCWLLGLSLLAVTSIVIGVTFRQLQTTSKNPAENKRC